MRPASELSDDELRAELKALGYDAGPISDTTRGVFVKKLNQLRNKRDDRTADTTTPSPPPTPKSPAPKALAASLVATGDALAPKRPMTRSHAAALEASAGKKKTTTETVSNTGATPSLESPAPKTFATSSTATNATSRPKRPMTPARAAVLAAASAKKNTVATEKVSSTASATPSLESPAPKALAASLVAAGEAPAPKRPMTRAHAAALEASSEKKKTTATEKTITEQVSVEKTVEVTSSGDHGASTKIAEKSSANNASSATDSVADTTSAKQIDTSRSRDTVVVQPRRQIDEKKLFQELNDRLANYIEIVRNLEFEKSRLEMQVRELTIKIRHKTSTDYDSLAQVEYERDSLRAENASLREQIRDSDNRLRVMNESCAAKDESIEALRAEIRHINEELKVIASAKLKVDDELRTYCVLLEAEESRLKLRTTGNSSDELFYNSNSSRNLSSTFNGTPSAEGYRPPALSISTTTGNDQRPNRKRRHMSRDLFFGRLPEQSSYYSALEEEPSRQEANNSRCAMM